MTRGDLDKSTLRHLNRLVPEAVSLHRRTLGLNPSFIEMIFGPETTRGIAAVCLDDAADLLTEARYALIEAHAHRLWHSQGATSTRDISELFWSRFYLDDAILRTYAAGESLGAFLYLELGGPDLRPSGRQPSSHSRLVSVATRVKAALPRDKLARRTITLVECPSWEFLKLYRDKWMHDQRPRLRGLGLTYGRRTRWESSVDGRTSSLTIGGGDPTPVTIEELFEHTDEAYRLLRTLISRSCSRLERHVRAKQFRLLGT